MKNIKLNRICYVLALLSVIFVAFAYSAPTYASEDPAPDTATSEESAPGGTGNTDFSLNQLETKATESISSVQGTVVRICMVLCPLAIIITLGCILFTHDDRKISGFIKICVTIAVVTALILLVNGGFVVSFITNLFDLTVPTVPTK